MRSTRRKFLSKFRSRVAVEDNNIDGYKYIIRHTVEISDSASGSYKSMKKWTFRYCHVTASMWNP